MSMLHSAFKSHTSPGLKWVQSSPFGSTKLSSIFYAGGYWVITGAGGLVAYTTNLRGAWTTVSAGFGSNTVYDCRYGNGYWVAVGAAGTMATCPTDPTHTWTQRSPGFGTSNVYGICYGNGGWAACADGGKLRTATDPTSTWTSRTIGFSTNLVFNVDYQNSIWVVVGNGGNVATASDCTGTWTSNDISSGGGLRGLAYGNGYWVVTSYSVGDIFYATNPASTWVTKPMSFSYECSCYGNGYWVLGNENSGEYIYRTSAPPTGTWSAAKMKAPTGAIYDIEYANSTFVGVGNSGMYYLSRG